MKSRIIRGDMLAVLPTLPEASLDACICDPPYHLTTGKKGGTGPASLNLNSPQGRARISTGFMGKAWDGGDIAFNPETWAAVLRTLKPGAHLLAFGGTRTAHRMFCAIEDAGFEIRDTVAWIYGTGMPKSRDILKPAFEPIILARKPFSGSLKANIARNGTGGLNAEVSRIGTTRRTPASLSKNKTPNGIFGKFGGGAEKELNKNQGRWPTNVIHDGSAEVVELFPQSAGQLGRVEDKARSRKAVFGEPSDNGKEYEPRNDNGSAARFFYCAKASRKDRGEGNNHPTVKPFDLMKYLVRLVTPPGGIVLDPFAGSGSTGKACKALGLGFIGIEMEKTYVEIARRRIKETK